MRRSDRAILHELALRLRAVWPEARVWAFGSRARGSAEQHSDFDLCVVLAHVEAKDEESVSRIAWEVSLERELVIVPLCFEEADFFRGPRAETPLIRAILAEGVAA